MCIHHAYTSVCISIVHAYTSLSILLCAIPYNATHIVQGLASPEKGEGGDVTRSEDDEAIDETNDDDGTQTRFVRFAGPDPNIHCDLTT